MFKSIFLTFATILLFAGLVMALGIGMTVQFNKGVCDRMTRLAPEYQFDFDFYGGCLVRLESGRWIDVSSVEYIEGKLYVVKQ